MLFEWDLLERFVLEDLVDVNISTPKVVPKFPKIKLVANGTDRISMKAVS